MDLYLAPLAEITSKEFRTLCYDGGADICYSEMISAKAVTLKNKKTLSLSTIDESEKKTYLQFFGGDPEIIKEAVQIILEKVTPYGIDINAGCPVRKVVAAKAGSALMDDPVRLGKIVKAVRSVTNLPLSVKIRKGFKTPNYLQCAMEIQDNGADLLIVHPRLRTEMFMGVSDYSVSIELADIMKIPVIHSGDVKAVSDLERFRDSNIKGLMIGRGALGAPWIFDILKGNAVSDERKKKMMTDHFSYYLNLKDKRFGQTMIRRHASWYSTGSRGSAEFRNQIFSPHTTIVVAIRLIRDFFGIEI
ncbi:MAG TPA: tRNA-dihydrouridine synthase family protein [bacterium]|nr:tRNA-dihydrouridine synthase family protein [bacterium]